LAEENDLLAAIIEFLDLDGGGPAVAEGPRFELQIGALFRLLSAADARLREEASRDAKLHVVPKNRSILGLVHRPKFRCTHVTVVDGVVAPVLVRVDVIPAVFVMPAFDRPLRPNKYLLMEYRFKYGDNLALLPIGRYMPELPNHKGFDLLLIDLCIALGLSFFTVIEVKFSQEDGSGHVASYVTVVDLAKKFVDALLEYPCLVAALLERRFCFVVATFQGLDQRITLEGVADCVIKKLAENEVKEKLRSPDDITKQHVLDAVLLLRRDHLKLLLTPTLDSRMHFFKEKS
jgi:hypothetical protein